MRLICGLVRLDGTDVSQDLLGRMAEQLDIASRQPAIGSWRQGPAGLAVLDYAARGAASIVLPEHRGSVIAGDVRLDEPDRLRTSFGVSGGSDDALLLEAVRAAGPDALKDILGDFAFAIWSPAERRLICGRDSIGARTLAYAHRPGEFFAFASFPKAIYGSGLVPRVMDDGAVARRIARVMSNEECLMQGILRLPPAHYLQVTPEGIGITRYWQIERAAVGTRAISSDRAATELRRLIDQAVRARLPRNGGVASHLSGGLDSSAVTVLAARALREQGQRLRSYSFLDRLRNDMVSEDETEFVEAVVEQEDLDSVAVRAEPGIAARGMHADPDRLAPFSSQREETSICEHAASSGIDLILTGTGGDETVSSFGPGLIGELLLRGRWHAALRELNLKRRAQRLSFARVFYLEVARHLMPRWLQAAIRRDSAGPAPLPEAFAQSLLLDVRKRHGAMCGNERSDALDGRASRWLRVTSSHVVERIEHWALVGARHGVAYTHPLLDRRVVEFAMSLPGEVFSRDGTRRRVFREAMSGVIPERVRQRTDKRAPFPLRLLDVVDNKDELVARTEACARDPNVRRLIDLDRLRGQLDDFPSPDQIRSDYRAQKTLEHVRRINAAMHTLAGAEYILQYGNGAGTGAAGEGAQTNSPAPKATHQPE